MRQYDKSLDSDEQYRQWEFKLDKAFSSGPNSLVLGGRYGRTLDDAQVVTSSFVFGGARQLSGFRQDSVSGQNISLMRMVYYRRLTPRAYLPLDFPLYLGARSSVAGPGTTTTSSTAGTSTQRASSWAWRHRWGR